MLRVSSAAGWRAPCGPQLRWRGYAVQSRGRFIPAEQSAPVLYVALYALGFPLSPATLFSETKILKEKKKSWACPRTDQIFKKLATVGTAVYQMLRALTLDLRISFVHRTTSDFCCSWLPWLPYVTCSNPLRKRSGRFPKKSYVTPSCSDWKNFPCELTRRSLIGCQASIHFRTLSFTC